jgi:phospholipase/lecithinase/hemolysin
MTRLRRIRLPRLALLLSVFATLLVSASHTAAGQVREYEAFYAFGDSLADTGDVLIATTQRGFTPTIPPSVSPNRAYYNGRFSNGPVVFEYLWDLLSGRGDESSIGLTPSLALPGVPQQGGVSFAFGGSGTSDVDVTPGGFPVPGLKGQVEMFRAGLGGNTASSRALYAILTGGNDYLRQVPLDPAQSVSNIVDAVRALYDLGARDVMVLNLPDLGSIPLVAGTPQSALLSALTLQHNQILATRLQELEASLPGLRMIGVDVNTVLNRLPRAIDTTVPAMDALLPAQPGEPPASRCLFIDPATCRDVPTFDVGWRYFYWDAEHPTTAVHALLARHLFTTVVQGDED